MTYVGVSIFLVVVSLGCVAMTASPPTKTALYCDFENGGLCNWSHQGAASWSLHAGTVIDTGFSTAHFAPQSDHTLGNVMGHYLSLRINRSWRRKKAVLTSPPVDVPESGLCFKFWYFMYGSKVNRLDVFANSVQQDASGDVKDNLVWTKVGTSGPVWTPAYIHVQNITQKVVIKLNVINVRGFENPFLDDFSMNFGPCPISPICDFENDNLCSFSQSTSDDLDWGLNDVGAGRSGTDPQTDHTFGTADGHFIHVKASERLVKGQTAVLHTSYLPQTSGSCLSFWYNMNGDGVGTLSVKVNETPKPTKGEAPDLVTLWTKSGTQGSEWLMGNVDLAIPFSFQIVFESVVGSNVNNTIAIDDITIQSGNCPALGSCDFESNVCSWRNMRGRDDMDWTRRPIYTLHKGFPPSIDHTFKTYLGHYLLFDEGQGREGQVSNYVSPPLDSGKTYCFNAWYMTTVGGNLTISVHAIGTDVKNEDVLFNTSSSLVKQWTSLRMVVGPFATEFNLYITGTVTSRYDGIAVDDLAIQEGHCDALPSPNRTKNAFLCPEGKYLSIRELCDFHNDCAMGEEETACGYDCDFEEDTTCNWEVAQKVKYTWSVGKAVVFQNDNGPSVDNTLHTGKGHYLYLQTKKSREYSDAMLLSPFFQRSAPNCEFVFSIFNHGRSRGTFKVKKVVGFEKIILFEAKEDVGAKWQRVILSLGGSEVPFRIVLEGAKHYGQNDGSIALDDLHFRNCDFPQPRVSCTQNNTFKCDNGACLNPLTVCNFADDCGDESDERNQTCSSFHRCDFESSLCLWSQESEEDDFDFIRRQGSTLYPTVDHTTATEYGYFLWTDTDSFDRLPGDKVWLLSPVLEPTSSCVLTFYLYMFGKHMESFSVYTRSATRGSLSRIYTRSGETGNFWVFTNVRIKSLKRFQIVLEGISGESRSGKIAIDDVVLSPECKISTHSLSRATPMVSPTPPPCGHSAKWQCADGSQCIFKVEVCDFIVQCRDGSDETDCGSCDFESSTCGWKDRTRGRDVWDRVNLTSGAIEYKPEKDHTRGAYGVGSYMLVHDKGFGYERPALLESPILGGTEAICSIRFFYLVKTGNVRLRLYPKEVTSYETESGVVLWTSGTSRDWREKSVSIGSRAAGFRLVFYYTSYSPLKENEFGAAIDDVSFTHGCGATKPSSFCSYGELLCPSTRECKPLSSRCDLAKDCQNGEDEEECLKYLRVDFEQGLKYFSHDTIGTDFNWTIQQPNSSIIESAPDRDHTYGSQGGHYLYMKASTSPGNGVARLKGPVMYGNHEGTCHIRLFYHVSGNYSEAINVYTETREHGALDLKWSVSRGEGDEWRKVDILLLERTLFRVVIEGIRGPDYAGDIGIDDVSFTPECKRQFGSMLPHNLSPLDPGSCIQGSEFPCDGGCEPISKWCDFKADCNDGTDEAGCPSQCDFEKGMCGWSNGVVHGHPVEWERQTAQQVKISNDHNPRTPSGHLLTSTIKRRRVFVFQVSLVSPLFRSSSKHCSFSFWVQEHSPGPDLLLKIQTAGKDGVIWKQNKSKYAQTWRQETITLPPCQRDFRLVLNLKAYTARSLPVLLDDFSFRGCALDIPADVCQPGQFQCANGLCIPETDLCDLGNDCCDWSDESSKMCLHYKKMTFERDMGGWKHRTGGVEWKRVFEDNGWRHSSFSDHTYPSISGAFLSFKCSSSLPGIIQHRMPVPNEMCVIRFWYQISQGNSGTIRVLTKTLFGTNTLLKSITSQTNGTWMRAEVKVDLKERYDLILEGKCGEDEYTPSVFVDDVVFSPGCGTSPIPSHAPASTTPLTTAPDLPTFSPCDDNQFQCTSDGKCIDGNSVCNFNSDCLDGSDESSCNSLSTCDFSQDLCGWAQVEKSPLTWTRVESSNVSPEQGPAFDASGTTGSYASIHQDPQGDYKSQATALTSSIFSSSASNCAIEFYHFLSGRGPGTMSLKIVHNSNKSDTLWQTNRKSDNWVKSIVWIGRRLDNFRLSFVRNPSSFFAGVMALDRIRFSSSCQQYPIDDKCGKDTTSNRAVAKKMYRCGRGACVSNSHVCDGQDDCGDGTDETKELCVNYIKENFDNPSNNWDTFRQTSKDGLVWSVWNSSVSTPEGLLGVDHSTGLPKGRYIYVEGSPSSMTARSAMIISSKPFTAPATNRPGCEVRFYTIIPSQHQTLNVGFSLLNVNSPITYKKSKTIIPGSYWQQVSVTFDDLTAPFQVVIEAFPGNGSIAIDDVTFGPDCKHYRDTSSSPSSSAGSMGWRAPVGVALGLCAVIGIVAAILVYLRKTRRIGGMSFFRLVEHHLSKGSKNDTIPGHMTSDVNPIYYDGKEKVIM